MGTGAPEPVQGPLARPPATGLAVSAQNVNERTNRWENGFAYLRECPGDGGVIDDCDPDDTKDLVTRPGQVIFKPYPVWAGEVCSTQDRATNWDARVRRMLEADQWFWIERELWTGEKAQAAGWADNRYLAHPDAIVVTNGPGDEVEALACLEQGRALRSRGRPGMIHATVAVVTLWLSHQLVARDGNLLRTALGTVVVPGAGYTGSDQGGNPAAEGSVWAYATDLVYVRLGDVDVLGSATDQTGVNYSKNDVEIRAERYAAATWDGCAHIAAEIDASVCVEGS